MKLFFLTSLSLLFASTAFAKAPPATAYVKTVGGAIVEISAKELQKANASLGLSCASADKASKAGAEDEEAEEHCQPVYLLGRGYAVFKGEDRMSDIYYSHADVVTIFSRLVTAKTCGEAPDTQLCELVAAGSGYFIRINGRVASKNASQADATIMVNAYKAAKACH